MLGGALRHATVTSTSASKSPCHIAQAYVLAKGLPRVPDSEISDVIPWQYTGNKLHPTQKPVSVLRQLIEAFSRPGQCVLDPFCGSGSTLIAAREAGRRSIGIELDERFARTAEQRLAV